MLSIHLVELGNYVSPSLRTVFLAVLLGRVLGISILYTSGGSHVVSLSGNPVNGGVVHNFGYSELVSATTWVAFLHLLYRYVLVLNVRNGVHDRGWNSHWLWNGNVVNLVVVHVFGTSGSDCWLLNGGDGPLLDWASLVVNLYSLVVLAWHYNRLLDVKISEGGHFLGSVFMLGLGRHGLSGFLVSLLSAVHPLDLDLLFLIMGFNEVPGDVYVSWNGNTSY